MHHNILDSPIQFLKGVGPKRAELLQKELGIHTYYHLLTLFPFRYVDRSKIYRINELRSDVPYIQIKGKITSMAMVGKPRAKRLMVKIQDDTGVLELVWFRGARWFERLLKKNEEYLVFGKPNVYNGKLSMPHPEIDLVSEADSSIRSPLQAVYSSTEKLSAQGLNSRGIGKLQIELRAVAKGFLPEVIPLELVQKNGLLPREESFAHIHHPGNAELLKKAIYRLKFEELFFIQLRILQARQSRIETFKGLNFSAVGQHFNTFYKEVLPFDLTGAQKRVVKEIRADMGSGNQMNRLLQGDVGSGKTIVAFLVMLIGIDNGFQTCIMAPTEILANQHLTSIRKLSETLGLKLALLTGSTKTAERKKLHEQLESGELDILIGTHALIEDKVKFKNLGLVVIDEQHRFGVAQRAKLWKKNLVSPPHILVMTATPIPRTLAMTLYGDLDVSVIDELPPGRIAIKTVHRFDRSRLKVFSFIKQQIAEGRQVYVVYPLINESEKLDYKDLMDGYESIERAFQRPEYQLCIVHGQMKPADKDFEMQRFVKGEAQIMVATNVIEVGVDIPNATVMVIESAERFGLSQLHQLRGRVGRGAKQSFCILMTGEKLSNDGKLRMQTMARTNDGFEIADVDLKLRGPGDLEGTQQSGILDLKIADLVKDVQILQLARDQASVLLDSDPALKTPNNERVTRHLANRYNHVKDWSRIS
ncbi:MAG: ATP-dependent DNA helicase RecG [Flavobacteriales bacterium]|nr:ATP-dependent DNA helicase RecG [Flavobacteriales bacterium]